MGIVGATDEFFCLFLNDLLVQKKKGILVVVGSLFEANTLYSSLINYTDKVLLFPMDDFLTSEALAVSPDLKISRLETLEKIMPDVYKDFVKTTQILEKHYKDMQDMEFTIENGKLYMLQTRNGKRTANADLK